MYILGMYRHVYTAYKCRSECPKKKSHTQNARCPGRPFAHCRCEGALESLRAGASLGGSLPDAGTA